MATKNATFQKQVVSSDIGCSEESMPIGTRVSWGKWGRGTVINSFDSSIIVWFDGNRHMVISGGLQMCAKEARKLSDNANIRYGSVIATGRLSFKPNVADIVNYKGKLYQMKGGIYTGFKHVNYFVPDINTIWHKASFEGGIWVDVNNTDLKVVKAYNPYFERESGAPDTVETLLSEKFETDIKGCSKAYRDYRNNLKNLFYKQ